MRAVRSPVLALILLLPLAAQGRFRGGRGRNPPTDETNPAEVVNTLFQQARTAAAALPATLAPGAMTALARDEMRLFPEQAAQDFEQAFQLALALPSPLTSSDPASTAVESLKEQAELDAVAELARRGHYAEALDLTRTADVPRQPLYDQLLQLVRFDPGNNANGPTPQAEATARQQRSDTIFSLVEECTSTGYFPYRGVAATLRRSGLDGFDRLSLIREGYRWAANETDPRQMENAVILLQAGHREAPELDSVLETTLEAMVRTLGQGVSVPPFGPGETYAGNRIVSLLHDLDPEEAQVLAQVYPNVGSSALQSGMGAGNASGQLLPPTMSYNLRFEFYRRGAPLSFSSASGRSFSIMALGPESAADNDGSAAAQFRRAVNQAEREARRNPGEAVGWANQADNLLDGYLWQSETAYAVRLAMVYHQLGDQPDAERLLSRSLDEADTEARQLDQEFFATDAGQRATMSSQVDTVRNKLSGIYSLCARIDMDATARRAQNAPFVLLKPDILARIAVIAEVGLRPAPIH